VDARRIWQSLASATEGPAGVLNSTSRSPTKRNEADMPGSASAVESWWEMSASRQSMKDNYRQAGDTATHMATTLYSKSQEPSGQDTNRTLKSRIRKFYEKHEKYAGLTIFGVGFIWDSFTMTRVDSMIDNIILLFYFVIIGAMIILTLRRICGRTPVGLILKLEPRILWAMQFCFGGLFSSYVIFYFKSASFTRTQFFFLVLVFLWIGNEFLEQRLKNPVFLAVLYSFCLFSFFAFFLPVITARVNVWMFLLAGILSLLISLAVFGIGLLPEPGEWRNRMTKISIWIFTTFLTVNILYFANLIPPVPLALKFGGIYHNVTRTPAGYVVQYVPPSIFRFWRKWDNPFYFSVGEKVYCYTAVFAPGGVRVPVHHIWSRKISGQWKRTDRIVFQIAGGRDGGYRGYTVKCGISTGEWRVEVETDRGQTLGRIDFTVAPGPTPHPPLIAKLIQ
jgi:hypothetical protein